MKKQIILVIFASILIQFLGVLHGAIPTQERAALIALYNSTNGDNWTNNSGWKTPPLSTDGFAMPGTEGSWYGVTLTGDNMYGLILEDNNLSGSIPSQLGNLSFLAGLDLSENKLSSSIPSQLFNLINLQYLDLYHNQLSGSIPSQLGNLSNLRFLFLSHNQLSGSIPLSFINLTALDEFEIDYNCLYATDPTLRAWLDSNQRDWESNQNQCGVKTVPTITTNSVSSITSNSAVCGGNVTSDGGSTVTARGVCWSTTSNPTTANSKTTDGSGTGSFTSSISGLNPNKKYYVRAYATNSIGTSYGANVNFTTESGGGTTPTVTTKSVSSITSNSAVCGGNVTSDGGSTVTARGVCWNTTPNPTTANSKTTDGSGTGSFTSNISGLNSNTKYYVRAYAANVNGTSYGVEKFFTTEESGQPIISLNRNKLNFRAKENTATGAQTISVSNSGSGTLNWTASSNAGWLNITPLSGSNSGTITVTANSTVLLPGTYTGTIVIKDLNAINSPQSVSVTLKVYQQGGSASPFGEFSTPTNGATVASSIPVTGWALDDIEITSLKIYNGDSYIGDAIFIEGARPDVEQAYSDYPMSYKAGWGYMLLSNFLPNGGNGTYTLYAKASDKEGNEVTLGSKTIYCDNAHAVKPFGAIDTPLQGGMASGKNYVNYGWLLTPVPNYIPANGLTISVFVDGVNIGHPTYNIFRADIANLFPGYSNSFGAVGYYYLDTTKLTDGVHTIYWIATDSAGNSDGIGSRYFMSQNSVSSGSTSANMVHGHTDIIDIPISFDRPIELVKGYAENDIPVELTPDNDGTVHIQCRELERIEVQVSLAGNEVEGYMIVGNRLMKLPIGSTLDKLTGRFSWIPGPGFIGTYRLVFIETGREGEKNRKNIMVSILPKFSGE